MTHIRTQKARRDLKDNTSLHAPATSQKYSGVLKHTRKAFAKWTIVFIA